MLVQGRLTVLVSGSPGGVLRSLCNLKTNTSHSVPSLSFFIWHTERLSPHPPRQEASEITGLIDWLVQFIQCETYWGPDTVLRLGPSSAVRASCGSRVIHSHGSWGIGSEKGLPLGGWEGSYRHAEL